MAVAAEGTNVTLDPLERGNLVPDATVSVATVYVQEPQRACTAVPGGREGREREMGEGGIDGGVLCV